MKDIVFFTDDYVKASNMISYESINVLLPLIICLQISNHVTSNNNISKYKI